MRVPRRFLLILVVGLATSTVSCSRNAGRSAVATSNTDVLRADEIRKSGATDALQAIRMLRPAFLRSRGRTSIVRAEQAEPSIYVDERLYGDVNTLRDIPANQVIEIRFFSPSQAQMRWGAGNSAGAILVRTGTAR